MVHCRTHTHFERISHSLTHSAVCDTLGYDPSAYDVQEIVCPTEDIRRAYALANRGYTKSRVNVERTVSSLDTALVYLDLPRRIPDLATLVGSIDRFLS